MTYLLDTDIVIDHLTAQPEAKLLLEQLLPRGVAISIVSYSEIYEGILGSRDPGSASLGFEEFLRGVQVVGVSHEVARRNAHLRLELRRLKRSINSRALDLLIAATAIEHDLILVTRNRRDYDDIPGLSLYE